MGHGVLGGARVLKHRRIQCPAGFTRQRPGCRDHFGHRIKIRFGRPEAARRRRQYNNVVG